VRPIPGRSRPLLVKAANGVVYIPKPANSPRGPNALFNEVAGIELYRSFRLKVPSWERLLLTEQFLTQNPNCQMDSSDGPIRPESGLCLGVRYLGDTENLSIEEPQPSNFELIRNRSSFWTAWLLDICCRRSGRREALFLEDGMGRFDAYFVDFESQFGRFELEIELWKKNARRRTHFVASQYSDCRIYPSFSLTEARKLQWVLQTFDLENLHSRVRRIPREWWAPSAAVSYMGAISSLRNRNLIQSITEMFLDFDSSNSRIKVRAAERE
jgi:hypothetical protein